MAQRRPESRGLRNEVGDVDHLQLPHGKHRAMICLTNPAIAAAAVTSAAAPRSLARSHRETSALLLFLSISFRPLFHIWHCLTNSSPGVFSRTCFNFTALLLDGAKHSKAIMQQMKKSTKIPPPQRCSPLAATHILFFVY